MKIWFFHLSTTFRPSDMVNGQGPLLRFVETGDVELDTVKDSERTQVTPSCDCVSFKVHRLNNECLSLFFVIFRA